MGTTRQLGQAAEARVDRAARARGWRRLVRNYNVRGGEIDMIYRSRDMLVIVEVRYRAHTGYGSAAASVTARKQRRIVLAARHFLARNPRYAVDPIRFDVVGVDAADRLDWVENAFYAE